MTYSGMCKVYAARNMCVKELCWKVLSRDCYIQPVPGYVTEGRPRGLSDFKENIFIKDKE